MNIASDNLQWFRYHREVHLQRGLDRRFDFQSNVGIYKDYTVVTLPGSAA